MLHMNDIKLRVEGFSVFLLAFDLLCFLLFFIKISCECVNHFSCCYHQENNITIKSFHVPREQQHTHDTTQKEIKTSKQNNNHHFQSQFNYVRKHTIYIDTINKNNPSVPPYMSNNNTCT